MFTKTIKFFEKDLELVLMVYVNFFLIILFLEHFLGTFLKPSISSENVIISVGNQLNVLEH